MADDGQLAETCRQDKIKQNLLLCLIETSQYFVVF
jgi:hypothetical protein